MLISGSSRCSYPHLTRLLTPCTFPCILLSSEGASVIVLSEPDGVPCKMGHCRRGVCIETINYSTMKFSQGIQGSAAGGGQRRSTINRYKQNFSTLSDSTTSEDFIRKNPSSYSTIKTKGAPMTADSISTHSAPIVTEVQSGRHGSIDQVTRCRFRSKRNSRRNQSLCREHRSRKDSNLAKNYDYNGVKNNEENDIKSNFVGRGSTLPTGRNNIPIGQPSTAAERHDVQSSTRSIGTANFYGGLNCTQRKASADDIDGYTTSQPKKGRRSKLEYGVKAVKRARTVNRVLKGGTAALLGLLKTIDGKPAEDGSVNDRNNDSVSDPGRQKAADKDAGTENTDANKNDTKTSSGPDDAAATSDKNKASSDTSDKDKTSAGSGGSTNGNKSDRKGSEAGKDAKKNKEGQSRAGDSGGKNQTGVRKNGNDTIKGGSE
nr:uncharacterized protein LOC119171055 isoform X2 [Rhipicephalus microplus]